MAKRLKLTSFSRFLIVMIFLVPLAYVGASYYNGEDGIQNIKELLGLNEQSAPNETAKVDTRPKTTEESLPETNTHTAVNSESVDKRLDRLEKDNKLLKSEILKLKTEIANLKGN